MIKFNSAIMLREVYTCDNTECPGVCYGSQEIRASLSTKSQDKQNLRDGSKAQKPLNKKWRLVLKTYHKNVINMFEGPDEAVLKDNWIPGNK